MQNTGEEVEGRHAGAGRGVEDGQDHAFGAGVLQSFLGHTFGRRVERRKYLVQEQQLGANDAASMRKEHLPY